MENPAEFSGLFSTNIVLYLIIVEKYEKLVFQILCAGHVWYLGGASPLYSLVEAKY